MDRWSYIALLLINLFCSAAHASNDWSTFPLRNIYPNVDKSDCVFPFTYNGRVYNDCTNDGNNGDIPWCSLTADYKGLFTYCYDFWSPTLSCLPSFTVNGKKFTGCDYLSKSSPYKQCKTNDTSVLYRYCAEAHVTRSGKPLIRLNGCDPDYKSLGDPHTMCVGPHDRAIVVPITATEKQQLLDKHNEFRAAVSSRFMFKLYWDDELAKMAQAHGNLCAFDHDLAANRLSPKFLWKNGQNMVMANEIRTPLATLLDMMLSSEKGNFIFGQGCNPDGTCLHYTQAMLSNITRVGCAQTHCLYPDRIERFLTCNYLFSQYQSTYKTPYVPSDTPAVDCPSNNVGNLCDCGDVMCDYKNGEYLDPGTCTCKKSTSKRSIDKRDADETKELNSYRKPVVSIPIGKTANLPTAKKRSLNFMS